MRSFINGGPLCCCKCPTFEENFNGTSLGDFQIAGPWALAGGKAQINAVGSMIHRKSTDLDAGIVRVIGTAHGSATFLRVYGAYKDAGNFHYMEIGVGGSSSTVKLMRITNGFLTFPTQIGSTITANIPVGFPHEYFFCWGQNKVLLRGRILGSGGGAAFNVGMIYAHASLIGGRRGGFGVDPSTGVAEFDDFMLVNHKLIMKTCPECEPCDSVKRFEDPFNEADFGWGKAPPVPSEDFNITGGRLSVATNTGASNRKAAVHRCRVNPGPNGFKLTIESDIYWTLPDITQIGIALEPQNHLLGVPGLYVGLWAANIAGGGIPGVPSYRCEGPGFTGAGGVVISQNPVLGDRLKIVITNVSGGGDSYSMEFFVNGISVHLTTATLIVGNPFNVGVFAANNFKLTCAWDNFVCQIGD